MREGMQRGFYESELCLHVKQVETNGDNRNLSNKKKLLD